MTSRVAHLLVIVTIVLGACSRNPIAASHESPTPSPSRGIAWSDCGGGLQCGTLQVPLDYANPAARTIGLALIRKTATDPANRIGSLVMNPGGPGEPGIDLLRGDLSNFSSVNRRFDLVSFDPRGVNESAPITCYTGPQLDAYLALDGVVDDPQEKQAAIQADKDFAAACQSRSGDLLPFMSTMDSAQDLDRIRAALGDEKLTYLGFSYGTFIGQWYAHLFPTHVRALALDGVVDPTVPANESNLGQAVGFQKNLDAFLADCAARASCAYGRSGNPGAKLNALMTRLDATPMRVGSRQLTRQLAMTGVAVTLYTQSSWTYLDQALTAVDRGDGSILLFLADFYNHRKANGTYANLFNGAFSATYCLDFPVPQDLAAYDALGPSFAKASSFFGPDFQYGNYQCAVWPVQPKHPQGPVTVQGAPPILLVGGTNDPATPFSESQSVNRQIDGSVLLTRVGNGHTSYDTSLCSRTAEDAYLINLTLPAPGTVCAS